VGTTTIGDGGTSTGAFHEALNQAAVEKLPLVLIVANNLYAYSTPTARQFACRDLAIKPLAMGLPVMQPTPPIWPRVRRSLAGRWAGRATATVRRWWWPACFACAGTANTTTPATWTAPPAIPEGRDCLKLAEQSLLDHGWAEARQVESWREEAVQEVEAVVAQVQREPTPDPFAEDWRALSSRHLAGVYPSTDLCHRHRPPDEHEHHLPGSHS